MCGVMLQPALLPCRGTRDSSAHCDRPHRPPLPRGPGSPLTGSAGRLCFAPAVGAVPVDPPRSRSAAPVAAAAPAAPRPGGPAVAPGGAGTGTGAVRERGRCGNGSGGGAGAGAGGAGCWDGQAAAPSEPQCAEVKCC